MTSHTDLPAGWARVRLDAIAEVRLGRQRSPKNHAGDQMRPYLRAANVTWGGLDLTDVKEMNFTEDEVRTFQLRPGDILLSEASGSATEVGKPAIWRGEHDALVCFQNTLLRVRPATGVLPEYLHLRLLSECLSGGFARSSRGVGIHHLGAGKLAELQVELPPTDEQGRIVAALEEQLSRVDANHAALASLTASLARLRYAVIVRAVGADWTEGQLADAGWKRLRLGDAVTSVRNGVFVSRPGSTPDGTAILRIGAVRQLRLDLRDRRWTGVDPGEDKLTPFLLQEGDLLFTRYNGNPEYVGACAVVPALDQALVYPDKLIRVRLDTSKALPAFVALACAVGPARSYIRTQVKTTAGQAGIAASSLKDVPLVLPPLEEQQRRAEEASRDLSIIEAVSRAVAALRVRTALLRQSLLAAGVSGRLAAQDFDDEPAELLLKRIAEERAASAPSARHRRASTVPATRITARNLPVEESA